MELYEVKQSENGVSKAYNQLMDKISEHITLLAKNDKPITSIMGIKRVLFRYRRLMCDTPPSAELTPPQMGRTCLPQELLMLVGEVLDKFDVDVLEAVEVGLIGEKDLKRVLIRYDYGDMAKQGMMYKDIKKLLSEKYGWSVSSIEKLVYKS